MGYVWVNVGWVYYSIVVVFHIAVKMTRTFENDFTFWTGDATEIYNQLIFCTMEVRFRIEECTKNWKNRIQDFIPKSVWQWRTKKAPHLKSAQAQILPMGIQTSSNPWKSLYPHQSHQSLFYTYIYIYQYIYIYIYIYTYIYIHKYMYM